MRMFIFWTCAVLVAVGCGGSIDKTDDAGTDTGADTDADTDADAGEGDAPGNPCEAYPGETCVVLEHEGDGEEVLIDFSINVDSADFYLLVDTTGTMDPSLTDIAAAFTTDILPAAQAAFSDIRFGLGHFNDFPTDPFGQSNDMPFWHMLDVTDDFTAVQTELDTLPGNDTWGNGQDIPEANVVALHVTASGLGLDAGGAVIDDQTCAESGAHGYPCFGPEALPVVIMVSDAPWHNGPGDTEPYDFATVGFDDAVDAFNTTGVKFLGVHITFTRDDGLTAMEAFATATASLDADSNPLVNTGEATTAGERAADLIDTLRLQARFDVACSAEDEPDDPPGDDRDATLFVQSIAPESADPPPGIPDPTSDDTTFYDAIQGTDLTFRVTLANGDYPSESGPVASLVWIVAMADSTTEIGRESVVVIVP